MIFIHFFSKNEKEPLLSESKTRYREFFSEEHSLPLFFEPWWLDLVCESGHWDAAVSTDKEGKLTGLFPYFHQRLKGLSVLSNPPLSPYLGISFFYPENQTLKTAKYAFENKVARHLIEQLPTHVYYMTFGFHPDFDNWYPFYFKGFHQTVRYTYIIDNIRNFKAVQSAYSQTLRRQIKQAQQEISTQSADTPDDLFRLLSQSLKKQQVKLPVNRQKLLEIYTTLKKKGQGEILHAIDNKGHVLAAMLLAWDQKMAYCLVLGMENSKNNHNAVKLLLHDSIQFAAQKVNRYNFEGSMIENVERVFRSFGGTRTPYYNILWYRNRWIRSAMAWLNK